MVQITFTKKFVKKGRADCGVVSHESLVFPYEENARNWLAGAAKNFSRGKIPYRIVDAEIVEITQTNRRGF